MLSKKTTPEKSILAIVFGLILLYIKYQLEWLLYCSLVFVLIGVFSTRISKRIDFLWMKIAFVLSLVIPKILLICIFYLILFPIAIISRLFGAKNAIELKNNKASFFIDVNKEFSKSSFEKPW